MLIHITQNVKLPNQPKLLTDKLPLCQVGLTCQTLVTCNSSSYSSPSFHRWVLSAQPEIVTAVIYLPPIQASGSHNLNKRGSRLPWQRPAPARSHWTEKSQLSLENCRVGSWLDAAPCHSKGLELLTVSWDKLYVALQTNPRRGDLCGKALHSEVTFSWYGFIYHWCVFIWCNARVAE